MAATRSRPHRWVDQGPVPQLETAVDPYEKEFGLNEAPTKLLAKHKCAWCDVERLTVSAQMHRGGSFRGLATRRFLYRRGSELEAVEERPGCRPRVGY